MRRILSYLFLSFALLSGMAQDFKLVSKDLPLQEVLQTARQSYGIKLSYSPKQVKNHRVDANIEANSSEELMKLLFDQLPFTLKKTGDVFLIIPTKETIQRVQGKIIDQGTGDPLPYAFVSSAQQSTVSDETGAFTLPTSQDTLQIEVSYLGYDKIKLDLPPNAATIEIDLLQNPTVLQEVIFDASIKGNKPSHASTFLLNPRQFDALPFLGETDVFKSLQLLPGVTATTESSSGFEVRGASAAQNLVLMDGFTIYHLDHFFGIFSTLNPHFINNVRIHKGGFEAKFGGRASSVVEVTGNSGGAQRFSGGAGINFLSNHVHFEAPLGQKISFLFGMRNSFSNVLDSDLYTDFLGSNRQGFIRSFDNPEINSAPLTPSIRFYDLNAKLQFRPSTTSTLDLNLYLSEDNYSGTFSEEDEFTLFEVKDQANWANAGLSLNYLTQLNAGVRLDASIAISQYSDAESLNNETRILEDLAFEEDSISGNDLLFGETYTIKSAVGDLNAKTHLTIELSEKNELNVGTDINYLSTDYSTTFIFNSSFEDEAFEVFGDSLTQEASVFGLFSSFKHSTDEYSANLGLRLNRYNVTDRWYFEPRLQLSFKVGDHLQIKGAATYHHQFLNQTSLSYLNAGQFYWILSDDQTIPVMNSTHLIVGGTYALGKWRFEAEYYRKQTEGIAENRFIQVPPELLATIDPDVPLAGTNHVEGLDVFVKYRTKIFNTWISYSLAQAESTFLLLNNNNPFPSDLDQRHEINYVNMLKLGKWELASTIIWGSGRPFTPPIANSEDAETNFLEDLEKVNQGRLPDYRRVDVSAKYNFQIKSISVETGISLFNVLNFQNIRNRRYALQRFLIADEDGFSEIEDQEIRTLDTPQLGFTPNFFLNVRF